MTVTLNVILSLILRELLATYLPFMILPDWTLVIKGVWLSSLMMLSVAGLAVRHPEIPRIEIANAKSRRAFLIFILSNLYPKIAVIRVY
jgi:hypothetical protein